MENATGTIPQQVLDLFKENLDSVKSGISTLVDFANQEVPEVLMQLLMWHGIKSGLAFLLALTCGLVCLASMGKLAKSYTTGRKENKETFAHDKYDNSLSFPAGMVGTGLSFGLFFSIMGMASHLAWLQILVAPKLYLIEYGLSVVK